MLAKIYITLKKDVLDPQGSVIANSLKSLGFNNIEDVRQGKYIEIKLTKTQEAYFKNSFIRQLFIFAVIWSGTRDIYISIAMTAAFVVLADHLFNEESRFCVIPKYWSDKMKQAIDTDGDGKLSDEEIWSVIEYMYSIWPEDVQSKYNETYLSD